MTRQARGHRLAALAEAGLAPSHSAGASTAAARAFTRFPRDRLGAGDEPGALEDIGEWNTMFPEARMTLKDLKRRAENPRKWREQPRLERTRQQSPKTVRRAMGEEVAPSGRGGRRSSRRGARR